MNAPTFYLAAAAVVWGAFAPVHVQADLPELPADHTVSACQTEDQNGCVWIAPVMGNLEGDSFYAAPDGTVTYLSTDAAAALLSEAL
jgi:hypothetical protein